MIKVTTSAVIIAVMTGLGGCASVNSTALAQESVSAEKAALGAPASWVFGEDVDGKIADDWNYVFNDPLLDGLIDEALKNNPSLRASAQNVARAEALINQARANLLPNLGAVLSPRIGGGFEGDAFADSYTAGLSASWEADLWGAIDATVLATGYDLVGTQGAYESARQALIASVARSYFLVIEANQQIDLSEKTLSAQQETLRIVNVRYEVGAASRRELVLAESDVAAAQDNLVVAKAGKTGAILSLQLLLGRYPDGIMEVSADFPQSPSALVADTPANVLRRRPDVIAAEFSVLSAFESRRAVQANTWPSLILTGSLNTGANSFKSFFDPASIAYSFGLQLADTIFDGGLSEARIEAATANQKQAIANYGQSVLNAYFEVESALNTIKTLKERTQYVQKNADAARETLALAEIQYKEGAIDLLDVLTFRQRSFQADRTLITLQRQTVEARIALYISLGGAGMDNGTSR